MIPASAHSKPLTMRQIAHICAIGAVLWPLILCIVSAVGGLIFGGAAFVVREIVAGMLGR